MNIATVRSIVRTALTTTLALGAFAFVAAPQAAQAQGFSVGVRLGQPAYGYVAARPAYGYDARFRDDRFRDHEAWEQQQAFLRQQELDRQLHFNHQRREAYDRGYNNGWR